MHSEAKATIRQLLRNDCEIKKEETIRQVLGTSYTPAEGWCGHPRPSGHADDGTGEQRATWLVAARLSLRSMGDLLAPV